MLNVEKENLAECSERSARAEFTDRIGAQRREWVAVNTILEERTVREVLPKLKAARATGIVEYPLNKVVL